MTDDYRDISGDLYAIPANRIGEPDDPAAMAAQMFGPDAVVVLASPEDVHRDAEQANRAAFFADARAMLDYLEAHPEVPLPSRYTPVSVDVFAAHDDFAEVDRVAGLLGVDPVDRGGSQRVACRVFGDGHASYQILANSSEGMARFDAVYSYRGSVQP
jgi:hypothetical protein